uniref:C-type lectin domain-containing protein n=1 Tax=Oncorhynchus kisutch TaxID=8019 RepID=A0A8C7D223_ONCKI
MGAKEKRELQSRSSSCPPGWHRYGTHCYYYFPILANWPETEVPVNSLLFGGNLASVHSLSQYNFLQSVIQSGANRAQRTWIGANDAIKEGHWLWSDGSSNHDHGAGSDNTNGREHCMEMIGGDFGQNDAACWTQLPFMCSRKL